MLSMYLFYHKNNFNCPEFFSGYEEIDNDFNKWIKFIYSNKFDRNKTHSAVNIFKYCFCNQLNWVKDSYGKIIENVKIYKIEETDLNHLFKNVLNLKTFDADTKIHPTTHAHYSEYYDEESKSLVMQHYNEDLVYFNYKY
jgi:hypothetical protein